MTSKKNLKKNYPTDQLKYNHREAVKGHKTLKHYINAVLEDEAKKEIERNKVNGTTKIQD